MPWWGWVFIGAVLLAVVYSMRSDPPPEPEDPEENWYW